MASNCLIFLQKKSEYAFSDHETFVETVLFQRFADK